MGWKSHFFVKIEFINTISQQRIEKRYQFWNAFFMSSQLLIVILILHRPLHFPH